MTFKKFEELFKTKYPEGEVFAHGVFGGTERSGQVEVIFDKSRRCYTYNGSYSEILNRVGVRVATKSDVATIRAALEQRKRSHGKPNPFSLFGKPADYSAEIREYEAFLEAVEAGDIIID